MNDNENKWYCWVCEKYQEVKLNTCQECGRVLVMSE